MSEQSPGPKLQEHEIQEYCKKFVSEKDSLTAKFMAATGAKVEEVCLVDRWTQTGVVFYPELKAKVFPDDALAVRELLDIIDQLKVATEYIDSFNRARGYPTGKEWRDVVRVAKIALAETDVRLKKLKGE